MNINQKGMTVIEALIVMALIGVIIASYSMMQFLCSAIGGTRPTRRR